MSPANNQAGRLLPKACEQFAHGGVDCLIKWKIQKALDHESHKFRLTRLPWIDRTHGVWNFFWHCRDIGFLRPGKARRFAP